MSYRNRQRRRLARANKRMGKQLSKGLINLFDAYDRTIGEMFKRLKPKPGDPTCDGGTFMSEPIIYSNNESYDGHI